MSGVQQKIEGQEADAGFTLIELMVVLLILAILLAIAIPTFRVDPGHDHATQSNLNTALTNAKAVYGNNQTYGTSSATLAASLTASEKSLTFSLDNVASTGQNNISVAIDGTGNGIILVSKSSNAGTCWGILTNDTTATVAATAPPVVAPNTATDAAAIPAWPLNTVAGTYYASWTSVFGACSADVGATITTTAGAHNTVWTSERLPERRYLIGNCFWKC